MHRAGLRQLEPARKASNEGAGISRRKPLRAWLTKLRTSRGDGSDGRRGAETSDGERAYWQMVDDLAELARTRERDAGRERPQQD